MGRWLAAGLALSLGVLPVGELTVPAAMAAETADGQLQELWDLANRQRDQGQLEAAMDTYMKALGITRRLNDSFGEALALTGAGRVFVRLGKYVDALKTYQKALAIWRLNKLRAGEAATLNNIASVYQDLGNLHKALETYEETLEIMRDEGFRLGEGIALVNLGNVAKLLGNYEKAVESFSEGLKIMRNEKNRRLEGGVLHAIANMLGENLNQPEAALRIYTQSLNIAREEENRLGEGIILASMGRTYFDLGKPKVALNILQRSLEILREVKDRKNESVAIITLGLLHRDRQKPKLAIENFMQGLAIQLEFRRGLRRSDRQSFLSQRHWAASSMVELLIEQKMAAEAFTWLNQFTTADLADYSRLIEARVSDPEAQRALEQWRLRQVELQGQRQRLEREPNEQSVQLLVDQEAAQFRAAEELIGRYPEIAELLETRPADLERLQAGIPAGTVVLQPAPLTGVPKRADRMALFALTRSDLQVVTVPLPKDFTKLVESYRQQLEKGEAYLELSQQFYDLLIRPLEDRGLLPAGGRLAVIATGKLREIPLETLYDGHTKKYLLEKYPIHYLTRLSRNGAPAAQATGGPERALVLANPTPTARELPGTEAEADYLVGAYPGSRDLRRGQATLEQFQQQASRYPILHLGTHGCFVATGCPDLGMTANTLLFANRQQYPIAEAAQLGLSNTELLVLGACQTAQITSDNDVGLSGLAYVWERAGARAVVASLWSAVDAESAQVTKAFYGNLKAGMDKAEAMRQAKLALLRRDPDGMHPFLWAPFIVIGDAAPLKGATQPGKPSP